MDFSAPWVPFLLGATVAAGLTIPALLRLRVRLARAERDATRSGDRISSLELARGQADEDLRFLTQFLKDYPRLARELYSGLAERQVPGVLLSVVQRSLDPQQVVVLVRRSDSEGERDSRFVVAAAYPTGGEVRLGIEIPFDLGDVGFAAETQLVLNRQDLEAAAGRIRPGPRLEGLPQPDLIAPLVFDQETLGVILVQQARRAGDPKTALRLVAQTGAQVLHTAAQVRRMKTTAALDGLTRVFNKKHMEQRLNELIYHAACTAFERRAAEAEPVSVFLLDIDHFKNYNDNNGHLAGDQALQELARVITQNVRKGDVFGRFGGEEFLLIQPQTDAAVALRVAEKLRKLIASHSFAFGITQPLGHMSISGGVAQYPVHGLDAAAILRAADDALYEAKRNGRDQVLPAKTAEPSARLQP